VSAGGATFTLNASGAGFTRNSVARVNGSNRSTTFVSATQLAATIPASDIAAAGTPNITVLTPAPGGGTSAGRPLTVANPTPAITALSPTSALAGSGALTLTVAGSGFANGAGATVGAQARAATVNSATQMTVSLQASDLANPGMLAVQVTNPAACASSVCQSNSVSLNVGALAPALTGLAPASVGAGGGGFTLAATGTGFTSNSVVRVNGSSRTTTFVSGTQLTAAIPASDIAATGTLNVTVLTPAPGGGTSSASPLTVASTTPPGGPSGPSSGPGAPSTPTFTRGQWTQWGSGSFQTAYTVSDGTLRDLAGNLIPAGTPPGNWGGNSGLNGRDLFVGWSQGGVWDLSRSQWLAGAGNAGWANFDLNIFDVPSGTWNPAGRPQRSYSEFAVHGHNTSYPANKALFGIKLDSPLAFVDVDNHYADVAGINPTTGTRLLPNVGHHAGSLVWMPSVGRVAWAGSYGYYWNDLGGAPGVWEWDPVTKKWALDIQDADYQPYQLPDSPPLCAVWDSRRNRVLVITGGQSGDGNLFAYDPAQPLGRRITRMGTFSIRLTSYAACVYDPKRDQLRVYGAFPRELGGQFGILSFSGGSNSGNNPGLTGFLPTGTFAWTGGAGLVYDPVADRDVVWFGGGQFNGGNAVGKTLYVVNPDTHVSVSLTPSAGADPGVPSGGDPGSTVVSIWSRFAYLPNHDAYAVIPRETTTGVFVFAPDRTSGPLASTRGR
jgi:hypothetical protein